MLRFPITVAALAALSGVIARPALAAEPDPSSLTGGEATRIGVYPLERLGPADPAYDRLQSSLRTNLALFPRVEAFDLATPSRCKADDLTCLVQVGRLAAADQVVHGSVERFGEGYAVRLQLIDVGRTTRREAKQLVRGAADLAASMELAACELVTTEPCEGTLEVKGAPGARVLVGSKDVGETPFEGRLRIGRHPVRVTRGGLSTDDTMTGISFRQKTTLELDEQPNLLAFRANEFDALPMPELPPLDDESPSVAANEMAPAPAAQPPAVEPPPPPAPEPAPTAFLAPPAETERAPSSWKPAAFKITAVGGAALLVSGAIFGVSSQLKASEINDKFERRTLTAGDAPLYDQARSRASLANIQFGLGGLGLAAAALIFVLDPGVLGGGGDVAVDLGPASIGARGSF